MTDSTQDSVIAKRRFRSPPWTKDSREWKRCDEQVPADHVARRIVARVERLNLTPLFESYSGRGSAALPAKLMLAVVLIEKHRGRQSPAEWFTDLRENVVLQWAGFGIRPSRSVCYEFRDRLGPLLEAWNKEVLAQAIKTGMTDASEGAIDGSTIAACASRHRLVNRQQLEARLEKLQMACQQHDRGEPVEKKGLDGGHAGGPRGPTRPLHAGRGGPEAAPGSQCPAASLGAIAGETRCHQPKRP